MNLAATFITRVPASIPAGMDEDQVSKYLSEIGRKGGQSRAKRLTPEERREIAKKAGKASGKVRKKKAAESRKRR
jgi:general stress protein YciG